MHNDAPGHRLRLACPAKVNLALSVGPPREDGMHPIASWMVALDFADTLMLDRLEPGEPSSFRAAYDPSAPVPQAIDWPREKDLAWRAYEAVCETTGRQLPCGIELHKRIPTGGGLGGGSSDAAAVLVGVDRLFNLALDEERLREIAQRLGSDVAFLVDAVLGRGSALVTGTGETIEPMPPRAPLHLTLVIPPFGCPTGPVYRAFDQRAESAALDEARVRQLLSSGTLPGERLFNDLEAPAIAVEPRLGELLHNLQAVLDGEPRVTGSGSVCFALAESRAAADAMAARVQEHLGVAAVGTSSLRGG
ncbi:MAG: 4-(cytidine 5'-diphospho)-2-C-methyl-D-erythritol kinase [Phycisphaeraceae bacterium]